MGYRHVWGLLVAAMAIGCGGDDGKPEPEPEPAPTAEDLFSRGDYEVGFRETELTYDPVGEDDTRSLAVRVWYPAAPDGEEPAVYSVAGIVSLPTSGALVEPAPAEGGPFPLAVYSHGSGGEGLLAYPYAELFASHGWVVVAPNHTGNTALDGFTGMFDPFASIASNRPADITALIDWVASDLSADVAGLAARTDEVFLFGHSFGGYTTFADGGVDLDVSSLEEGCTEPDCSIYAEPEVSAHLADLGDPRIVAIAPQAPALVPNFADGELAALEIPTMLQSGRRDMTTTNATQSKPAWAGLDHPDDMWVELPDGGHLSFISACDDIAQGFLDQFQPNNQDDGCGPDFTPVSQTVPALAAYLLGFARLHVLSEEAWRPILTGEPLDPAVVVTTR